LPERKTKIGYLLGVFPALSMTFVMREIRGLAAQGFEVAVFAVKRQPDGEIDPHFFPPDAFGSCMYARPDCFASHLWSNLKALALHPRRYFKAAGLFWRQVFRLEPAVFLRLLYHFFCGVGFAEQIRRAGIAHLHCHFETGSNIALAIHRFCSIPFSFTAHASGDIFVKPVLLAEKMASARFVVAVCEYTKKYLDSVTAYRHSAKIVRIYNGVDVGEPEELLGAKGCRRKPGAGAHARIVSVGRLIGCKGYGTLVETCRILKDRELRFTCEIIGAGPDSRIVTELAARWNLEDTVLLPGALPLSKVYKALGRADIFALLSEIHINGYRDGFPTVLLEAMVTALPVVATWISGIPEMVVHGRTGLLVPERDAEAAAAALERLMADEELRLQMGEAGRLRALEMFDGHSQHSALAALMQGALRAGQGGK